MATNATGRNFRVAYIAEVTPGTTPASPLQLMRLTGGNHAIAFQSIESAELQLAETPDLIRVGADGTLTIDGELSYGALDDFFSGIAFNPWSTNVLTIGQTRQTFTLEFQYLDIGRYVVYKKCIVTNVKLTLAAKAKITYQLTFAVGILPTASTTATIGSAAATAAPTNSIMSPVTSIQLAQEGGSGSMLTTGCTAFSFDIARAIIPEPQLGSLAPSDIDGDALTVKGSVSLYMPNLNLFDKILADTTTKFALTLGGVSSKNYAFLWNNAKLASGGPDAAAKAKAFLQTYNWQALYDATYTTQQITRTP